MTTLHVAEEPLQRAGAPALALVRKRVVIALATMFVVEVILSSPLVGGLVGVAPAADLGFAALTIMTQAVALPLLMVLLARRILEPAEQLDEARDHFRELYDRARLAGRARGGGTRRRSRPRRAHDHDPGRGPAAAHGAPGPPDP